MMRTTRRSKVPCSARSIGPLWFGLVASLAPVVLAAEPSEISPFLRCDVSVRQSPATGASYRCYLEVARSDGSFQEAGRRLKLLLQTDPDNPWPLRWLAQVEADQGREVARGIYLAAAEGFADTGEAADEVETRSALARFLLGRGMRDAARRQLDFAGAALARGDSHSARSWLEVSEARYDVTVGDYGGALRRLESIEPEVFSHKSVDLRASWLVATGAASWYLGDYERSNRCYRRVAELLAESGDVHSQANALTTLVLLAGNLGRPQEEKIALARQALKTALAGGNLGAAGRAHAYLGDMLPEDRLEEKIGHAETAVELSRSVGDLDGIQMALRGLAHNLVDQNPDRALKTIDEAIALARRNGQRQQEARNRVVRSRLLWNTGPRQRAIEASLEALDAIEATREFQPDAEARARRFSTWVIPYIELIEHVMAGDLLPPAQERGRADLELAFRVTERVRARVLLDELDASAATPFLGQAGDTTKEWLGSQREISRLQRLLRDRALDEAARGRVLADLETAERQETGLRAELARLQPAFGAVRAPKLAEIHEVQDALAEDQALVGFWLSKSSRGTSRAFVVTPESVDICSLPASETIDPAVSLYLGLVGREDDLEVRGAGRLHDLLLDCPMENLPPRTRRLVILPHSTLHRIPLHALRPSPRAEPLGARFEIVTAPSATVWLRLRESPTLPSTGAALALADPSLGGDRDTKDSQSTTGSGSANARAVDLGPLPRARREGRSVVRHAGSDSVLLVGARASESAVKQADLGEFSILHFAAHALTDDLRPDRSAILLAPGAVEEDGLLQLREIVGLDLSGQLVVLSGCRSASGLQVHGEGVLGLARGFFVAGARTVVGSLWPLRDVDAEALFEDFYRGLGEGRSVAAAMAAAQRSRRRAGAPPAAWAGVVVLGDGDLVPFPGGRRPLYRQTRLLALVGVAAVVVLPILGARFLRGRQRPCP